MKSSFLTDTVSYLAEDKQGINTELRALGQLPLSVVAARGSIGLVFFGDESSEAVDAKSGKSLWHFPTGQKFHA